MKNKTKHTRSAKSNNDRERKPMRTIATAITVFATIFAASDARAKYHDDESDLIYYGYRYCNPTTGRWLTRDPIEERGGVPLYAVAGNDVLNRIDRLGHDYVMSIVPGYCNVDHRVMYGDDGAGGHFRIELVPNVRSRWTSYRRVCGEAVFRYTPGAGSVTDAIGNDPNIREVESRVTTTPAQDRALVAAAAALAGTKTTYCLGALDCRHVDDCVLDRAAIAVAMEELARKLAEAIAKALNDQ